MALQCEEKPHCAQAAVNAAWCHPGSRRAPALPLAGVKAEPDPPTAELKNHPVIYTAARLYSIYIAI